MKVIEHINESKGNLISFEILPPLKGKGINALWEHLDPLMEFGPAFINVTYHRSEHVFVVEGASADASCRKRSTQNPWSVAAPCRCGARAPDRRRLSAGSDQREGRW